MSVVSCRETFPRRSAQYRATNLEQKLRRHYYVKTSSLADDATTIFSSGLLPAFGTTHPGNTSVFVDSYSFDQKDDSGFLWDVVVEYASASGGGLPQFAQEFDPTLNIAEISWDSVKFRKPVLKADFLSNLRGSVVAADVPICNSAGVPYNPPVEIDDSRPTVTITKNLPATPPWIIQYQDAINSDAFFIDGVSVEPYQAKVDAAKQGPHRIQNGIVYRQLTLVIQFQKDGWDVPLLDAGFEETIDSQAADGPPPVGAPRRKIFDAENTPVREPKLLDRNGQQLEEGEPAEFRDFRVYKNLQPFAMLVSSLGA